jgi:hypothetical protein
LPFQNGQYIEVVCRIAHPATERTPCCETASKKAKEYRGWLIAYHPSQDGKAVSVIEKIIIADTNHFSNSWFKTEILVRLNRADVKFVDPSENDGVHGILTVQLTTPAGLVVLD